MPGRIGRLPERGEDGGVQVVRLRTLGRDVQLHGGRGVELVDEPAVGRGDGGTSSGGQFDQARRTLKQRNAKLFFQCRDLPTQWWLRDVQKRRGAAEMKRVGQGHEVAELAKVDCH